MQFYLELCMTKYDVASMSAKGNITPYNNQSDV